MNMLTNLHILSIHRNIIKIKVNSVTTKEELFDALSISKARQKLFNISNDILYPKQIYTVETKAENKIQELSNSPIDVVYEDDLIMIVNKPFNLLVHNDGNTSDTLTSRVHMYAVVNNYLFFPLPIHRIDKDTSGLVLFSKQPFFHSFFDQQISEHVIQKTYLALVKGIFPFNTKEIKKPIARDRHNAKKMRISKNGKDAYSKIEKLKAINKTTLLRVHIKTGRKHQIRVHLSSLGFPILNDPLYGSIQDNRKLLLQSYQVTFFDPVQKKFIKVTAPLDSRFRPYTNLDIF